MDAQLRGRVVDVAGFPLPDATVLVIRAPGPVPDVAAVTDADGRFAFAGVPAGRYRLRAIGPGAGTGETDAVASADGEPAEAVIRVGPQPDTSPY